MDSRWLLTAALFLAGWSNPGAGIDSRRAFYLPLLAHWSPTISPLAGSWYIDGQARGWSAVVKCNPMARWCWRRHRAQSGDSTKGDFLVARYHGFPSDARNCSLDIDGDGVVSATTDSLMHARIALGTTGSAVTSGITFAPNALRSKLGCDPHLSGDAMRDGDPRSDVAGLQRPDLAARWHDLPGLYASGLMRLSRIQKGPVALKATA